MSDQHNSNIQYLSLGNKLKVTRDSNVVFDHVSSLACILLSLDVGNVVEPIIR